MEGAEEWEGKEEKLHNYSLIKTKFLIKQQVK